MVPNSAPAQAPVSIWPSIATLMTPERSHSDAGHGTEDQRRGQEERVC